MRLLLAGYGTNIELSDLREMLKQASVRLVLLQKAHMQALKDNASLEMKLGS